MNKIVSAPLSGAAAGIPMTLFMTYVYPRLPWQDKYPLGPREITENITKKVKLKSKMNETEMKSLTMISHFSYSSVVGGLFFPLAEKLKKRKVLAGAGFGLLVWAVGYAGWVPLLGLGRSPRERSLKRNSLIIGAHVIWGVSLGMMADTIERRKKLQGF